ncbi:MAG: hypothetical protein KGL13_00325 [Gammaproteobacteria bacterium]|nr:hypothetical protein [Gammaproteobacteria bacterium]
MTTLKFPQALLAALLLALPVTGFSATDTATAAAVQKAFMQFDQNPNRGWRPLQLQRNYQGASDAILQFMSQHAAQLNPWQNASLAFHLGHVYALMDDRADAIRWFRKSISYHVMGNPAYAQGFIAFLQNDKQALLADRHSVAVDDPGPWQSEDLKEMDAMIDYFGSPFEAAWGALNCIGTGAKADPQWAKFCRTLSVKYHYIYAQHIATTHSR